MGYLIYTHEQIIPAKVVRPRLEGGNTLIDNPAKPILPGKVIYYPIGYSRFASDVVNRTILIESTQGIATEAEILTTFPNINDAKYERLWLAAHLYEQQFISGVGLSILSLGVAQSKPKALAVAAWSNNLWVNYYYPRKQAISFLSEPDCDFTIVGNIPHTVPELSAEIY